MIVFMIMKSVLHVISFSSILFRDNQNNGPTPVPLTSNTKLLTLSSFSLFCGRYRSVSNESSNTYHSVSSYQNLLNTLLNIYRNKKGKDETLVT